MMLADGLKDAFIFGVNGGVTHLAGQSVKPVSFASSGGNGMTIPDPFLG
jgi:hypothetical protein